MSQHRFILIGAIVLLPVILFDLLKFSNRVAGPLYRCRKIMTQMSRGESVPEFKPRKHDLMPELFLAFDELVKEWNARIESNQAMDRGVPTKKCATEAQHPDKELELVEVK